ncbi:6-phospho-3-hexuloisomerase [Microlunatus antarcticus]|uniref:6-phospho-3-hexuloisomerase n=1 Tax=Microlunatus antarcticus TaxID=53388 RepID=A0A7W5P703_9ACTN|nr:6-phospho-3-hexuloisomerase [Microlunatus antarcticus]MBB3327065.1 6-phospho-3-hexuloisomerase [Microlunatus antarcticus]
MSTTVQTAPSASSSTSTVVQIAEEISGVAARIQHDETAALEAAADRIRGARRVFVHGAGRSGIALRMVAMRLMHLGLEAHVVGEATAPALGEGDLLIAASGSGTTGSVVRVAEATRSAGGEVLALTTDDASPLAALATTTVVVPAAAKSDRSSRVTAQYAGSLFEQSVLVVGDALFAVLWHRSGQDRDQLKARHANLE